MKRIIYRIFITVGYLILIAILSGQEIQEIMKLRMLVVIGFSALLLILPELFMYQGTKVYKETKAEVVTKTVDELTQCFFELGLTRREAEVALLLYQKKTNREIADELYISESTVKKHITHIFEKLGIERREQILDVIE